MKEGLAAAEAAGRLPPLTPDHVADVAALTSVLGRPFSRLGPTLGGIAYAVEASYVISASESREVSLDEQLSLRIDNRGQYHLEHGNTYWSREDQDGANGRSCWWVDGEYYTGRRHGPAARIQTIDAEHDRCLDSGIEPFIGLIELVLPHAEVEMAGADRVAGREVLKVEIRRAGRGIELSKDLPLTWPSGVADGGSPSPAIWGPRASLTETYARPLSFAGEIAIDVETGAPISGRIEGRYVVRKADRDAVLGFRATLEAAVFTQLVTRPDKVRDYESRPRLFRDRERLLAQSFKNRQPIKLPGPGDAPPLKPFVEEPIKSKRQRGRRYEDVPESVRASEIEDAPE